MGTTANTIFSNQGASGGLAAENAKALKEIEKNLEAFLKKFAPKERKKMLLPAAKVFQKEVRSNIPVSKKAHHRYNTAKLLGSLRAPKNSVKPEATYEPGNLRRAIQILLFRKSPDLFVGPKVNKSGSKGVFAGRRVDGYYAHWVEFGTPHYPGFAYMRKSLSTAKSAVRKSIEMEARKKVKNFKPQ